MPSSDDKATLRRIPLEAINQGRLDVIDEVLTGDFLSHSEGTPFPPDREGLKTFISALRSAFPDINYSIIHEIAEGDLVVQHVYVTGTMRGEFGGMQATGKSAAWDEVHITRMRDGRGAEHWPSVDQLDMLQQLGVIPVPEARAA
jgi:predicted ester cyclase